MGFGHRLKKLRMQKKMTQQELGNLLNVTKVSISGYENETRSPDQDSLVKIAQFFNVSTDYLLGNTQDPTDYPLDDRSFEVMARIMESEGGIFIELIENLPQLNEDELVVVNDMVKSLISLKQKKS